MSSDDKLYTLEEVEVIVAQALRVYDELRLSRAHTDQAKALAEIRERLARPK